MFHCRCFLIVSIFICHNYHNDRGSSYCVLSTLFFNKTLSHLLHWYGFSIVYVLMFNSNTIFSETLATMVTLIWFIPGMRPHMSYMITICKESLITLVSLTWFISSVYSHMYFKFIFHWVSYATMAALVWFISCMSSHVL